MTEPPTGGPTQGGPYDPNSGAGQAQPGNTPGPDAVRMDKDRERAEREHHEPEEPLEGPLHMLSQAAWQVVLLTGIASLILGVLVLIWPGATLVAVGVLFGLYLLVSGVFQLVSAFGTHKKTSLRVLAFLSGGLSILLGLLCFRGPMQSILLLALWIGIGWLIRGITQTMAAISDKAMPARGWHIFLGIVTFIAGIVLIDSPFESVAVLTLVGGWWLIVVGIVEIITSIRIKGRAKNIPQTV
ncbi:HdeD family acid-resistance protein [Streptomyces sp. NRRL F-2799]|uniref:HdeD family acid-resistance protein n=1 Tax=Streptomyces sp. NRRL F-2799 TaxID=1463844 RepID=UPI0004C626D4|nr:HdeD family acid-resistance protein [Streptomyces sp. NRRL F-2799]